MIDRIDRKREVLVHVAKYCFEGTLEAHKEFIPLEIVPHGSQPTHRCCVYREREVLRNRVDWACGRASVYDGENHYTFTDQPVAVMNSACEGCPLQRYTVTSNCQHCMAQRCLQACRFGAITMTHQGDHQPGQVPRVRHVRAGLPVQRHRRRAPSLRAFLPGGRDLGG